MNAEYRTSNIQHRMKMHDKHPNTVYKKPIHKYLKYNIKQYGLKIKKLQGDPHYVALGMAIGVFVGVTPTIPFHTILAVALALVFRCSKPAAALGVWFANPVTIPFFYWASYKVGLLFWGRSSDFDIQKYESVFDLFRLGLDVLVVMILGGVLIAIPPAVIFYFLTRIIFVKLRSRAKT